jgi:transcriptional antiterminator NusG
MQEHTSAHNTDNNSKKFFVVQVRPGYEKEVSERLQARIDETEFKHFFGRILIPTEKVVERKKDGNEKETERKLFPGYMLLEMTMNRDTWHLVKKTKGISGFIGPKGVDKNGDNVLGEEALPLPLSPKETQKMLDQIQEGTDKPRQKLNFEVGQLVEISEGPFKGFRGEIKEVNYENASLKVGVLIFGRETTVDLNFTEVQKEKI